LVGEQGPELANLGPSRGYSHNNSRALLDTTALQNEIAALRSDLRAGQAAMAHSLKIMEKKVKQWDGEGMPDVRA
jgi:DNA-binding transcriptional regulator YiaG